MYGVYDVVSYVVCHHMQCANLESMLNIEAALGPKGGRGRISQHIEKLENIPKFSYVHNQNLYNGSKFSHVQTRIYTKFKCHG